MSCIKQINWKCKYHCSPVHFTWLNEIMAVIHYECPQARIYEEISKTWSKLPSLCSFSVILFVYLHQCHSPQQPNGSCSRSNSVKQSAITREKKEKKNHLQFFSTLCSPTTYSWITHSPSKHLQTHQRGDHLSKKKKKCNAEGWQ